jgi:uncharacterized lipoprotein YajG
LLSINSLEATNMIRSYLAAAAALAMMTGVAVAQTSSSSTTSTQSTTATPAPVYGGSVSSSSQQSTSSNGVTVDKTQTYANGIGVTPTGDLATTKKSTETTTVH